VRREEILTFLTCFAMGLNLNRPPMDSSPTPTPSHLTPHPSPLTIPQSVRILSTGATRPAL
jgi:hypothetical protein